MDPKQPRWTFYKQVGFEEVKSEDSVAETGAQISAERLKKSDSAISKDQSNKSDSKSSKETSKTERTVGTETQNETGAEDKKRLRWL